MKVVNKNINKYLYGPSKEEIEKRILNSDKSPDYILQIAVKNGSLEGVKIALKLNPHKLTIYDTLIYASQEGYLDIVKYLIEEKNINPNINDSQAIVSAAIHQQKEVFKYLIEQGADIESRKSLILHYLGSFGDLDLTKYLKKKGINIHADDEILLRHAAKNGYLDVVKYLVESGANIHTIGEQALFNAAARGDLKIVKYLVEQGADVNNVVLHVAFREDVVNYLKSQMNKE